MLFITCQKCGRPLSEGAVARGDATEEGGALTCSNCQSVPIVSEPQIEPAPISALSHYDNAVWNCESCSIPINALDLIEGRASKAGGRLLCGRCGKSVSGRSESIQQSTEKAVEPEPVVAGRIPPKYLLRKSISNEASFTAKAEAESKRPMLPVVLFAIILPMFAISLYFAVMSQQKLNELRMENAAADRDDTKDDTVDRSRPAPEPLIPGRRTEQPEMPNVTPTSEPKLPQPNLPEPAPPTPINPISAETAKQLAEIEQDLARPVNALLESDNLADVWEGLSQAGSQRLIACRPWVRRLLLDQDDNTRALSAHVCGLLEDEDALTQLDRMSESDPSDHVRLQARKARSRLTGQATRELADFGTKELEKLLRELKEELSRRNRADD